MFHSGRRCIQFPFHRGKHGVFYFFFTRFTRIIVNHDSESIHGLPCCLMHNRKEADYRDFMQDVAADLADTIHLVEAAGIADEKIILDLSLIHI